MMCNDLCKIKLKLKEPDAIKIKVDAGRSSGITTDGVVSITKDDRGLNVLYSDGSTQVISLVYTKDGRLLDENGNELLPGPISIEVLGDSEV